MTESNNDNAGGSIETSEHEARLHQQLILTVPERLREYAESQCASVDIDPVVRKSPPEAVPPEPAETLRQRLYRAALACGHLIVDDEVILHRNDKIDGNALSQLADRLEAAVMPFVQTITVALLEWKAIIHDDRYERGDRLQRISSRISEVLKAGAEYGMKSEQGHAPLRKEPAPNASAYDYAADKLWMIHILGPDDIYAAPSMVEAYEQAAKLQRYLDANGSKSENAPTVTAVVVEWDGTTEAHAQNIAGYWSDIVTIVVKSGDESPQEQAPQVVTHVIPCRRYNLASAGSVGVPACPIDCPCWGNEKQPAPPEHVVQYSAEFKNFHRMLCDRFEYAHDDVDWWRDQVSLMEYIAGQVAPQATVEPLTDAQIDAIVTEHGFSGARIAMHKFSRALLATPPTSKATAVSDTQMLAAFNSADSVIDGLNEVRGLFGTNKATIPPIVADALERMCAPLDESFLSGWTARADAHSMKIIRDYILSTSKADTGSIRNEALDDAILACTEWGDRGDAYDCAGSIRELKSATPSTIKTVCKTCDGHQVIDETLGGSLPGVPDARCPDCLTSTIKEKLTYQILSSPDGEWTDVDELTFSCYSKDARRTIPTIKAEPTLSGMERAFSTEAMTARDERQDESRKP